jgi:hypothetical protein
MGKFLEGAKVEQGREHEENWLEALNEMKVKPTTRIELNLIVRLIRVKRTRC